MTLFKYQIYLLLGLLKSAYKFKVYLKSLFTHLYYNDKIDYLQLRVNDIVERKKISKCDIDDLLTYWTYIRVYTIYELPCVCKVGIIAGIYLKYVFKY